MKFGETSSFDLANGSTSWILAMSGAVYHVVLASLSRLRIGSNATDALIEDIRVEVLKFQMPSFKTYADINCRMKV